MWVARYLLYKISILFKCHSNNYFLYEQLSWTQEEKFFFEQDFILLLRHLYHWLYKYPDFSQLYACISITLYYIILLSITLNYIWFLWEVDLMLNLCNYKLFMTDLALILLIVFILFCLFVVLVERKFLAHAQRRFGPSIAGRNGWLQIVLDLIKLATKELFIVPSVLTSVIPGLIGLFFTIQLLFIQNFVFAPSTMFLFNVEGMIFFHLILVMLSNIILILIGFLSQSKYSIIGVFRAFVHVISMDIFITLVYVLIIFSVSSGSFGDFILIQTPINFITLYFIAAFLFLIIMLLESKRAPFDHVETEAEVVSGYATEYSGIFLLTFYLVEYFHLIVSANHFTLFFLGGWSFNYIITSIAYVMFTLEFYQLLY